MTQMIASKITIIFGGPSLERGISINSARSLYDHLSHLFSIDMVYVNHKKEYYQIQYGQLYSNTPSDFDFKLKNPLSEASLISLLKTSDIVFPAIHGEFGEDGTLQALLEQHQIPFVGSSSDSCLHMFDKNLLHEKLKQCGFKTWPRIDVADIADGTQYIVKPARSGSSIGVKLCDSILDIQKHSKHIANNICQDVIIEPLYDGVEFTVVVIEKEDEVISLIPTEIILNNGGIFDYRKKYFPTYDKKLNTPPSFDIAITETIRQKAVELFRVFGAQDFVRIDGIVRFSADAEGGAEIIFTDFNPICGMEQNSFLFKQASILSMKHEDILTVILCNAAKRHSIMLRTHPTQGTLNKKDVYILLGGMTAERQVSLMSGINVFLKLGKSEHYTPHALLFRVTDEHEYCVWYLPYYLCLNHTVEEIYDACLNFSKSDIRVFDYINAIAKKFNPDYKLDFAYKLSFIDFLKIVKERDLYVFLALHGGDGENGTMQELLELNNIRYNGSNAQVSKICMDKYKTAEYIADIQDDNIDSLHKVIFSAGELVEEDANGACANAEKIWQVVESEIGLNDGGVIIKPRSDGCSSGVIKITSYNEFLVYIEAIRSKSQFIVVAGNIVQMPQSSGNADDYFMVEKFIETDEIFVKNGELTHNHKIGWVELTVAVIGDNGAYHSLNPSITLSENAVLTAEEKFQGGTGINLTPPPEAIISHDQLLLIKNNIEKIAKFIKIKDYARIDIFFNITSDKMIVIEINTLPALTPSTVIYHQVMAEATPIDPIRFLESIIDA